MSATPSGDAPLIGAPMRMQDGQREFFTQKTKKRCANTENPRCAWPNAVTARGEGDAHVVGDSAGRQTAVARERTGASRHSMRARSVARSTSSDHAGWKGSERYLAATQNAWVTSIENSNPRTTNSRTIALLATSPCVGSLVRDLLAATSENLNASQM